MREKRYQPPGVPPGTLTPLEQAVVPKTLHILHYTPEALQEADVASPADVAYYRSLPGITWVNVDGLGDVEVIRELGRIFGLHPLALEDVLNVPQRPKLDAYDDHLFLVVRMLHYNDALQAEQVSLFLGRNYVITFQEDVGDCLDPIRDRLRKGAGQLRKQGADFLMYAILDAIIDHYFPFLESFGETVESLEDLVVERPTQQTLADVHEVRRDLLNVRRCIWPLRDVLSDLIRDESPFVAKNTRVYLRDCLQHTVYLLDVLETYRELASSLVDVYVSSASNRLNEIMKVLTIITTIFIPLSFVAGVYGMNFRHMPELDRPWAYPLVLAVMVGLALSMLWLFRRRGWLGSKDTPEPADRGSP